MSGGRAKRISVQLTAQEVGSLEELAKASDRSVSWMAARAIRLYLVDAAEKRLLKQNVGDSSAENPRT